MTESPIQPSEPGVRYEVATLDLETVQRLHREGLQREDQDEGLTPPADQPKLLAIEDAVGRMPDEDLDKARVIYEGLAGSDFPMDRNMVATFMPNLARHDWVLASKLWRGLLRDDDGEVCGEAVEALSLAISEQQAPPENLAAIVDDLVTEFLNQTDRLKRIAALVNATTGEIEA